MSEMLYAKNFKTLEEAKPDFAETGVAEYIHQHDVAKMFRLYSWLIHENDQGNIDAGDRLIHFRKKLISWEAK